jgi:hypothetical protein
MKNISIRRLLLHLKSDAFILQAPSLAAISSAVLIVCCLYSFCVLASNVGPTGLPGTGVEAVSWAATLAVFYGVFLETRSPLAKKFGLAISSATAAHDYADSDERHGMGLLCIGLLCEAVTGVPGLHDKWPWIYTVVAVFFLIGIGLGAASHLWRHWHISQASKTVSSP